MKTKPFNIDEAKRTLRAVTRAGEPVRLFAFDLKGAYPILGAIPTKKGVEYTARWTVDGSSVLGSRVECNDSDLRSPVETITRYLNIYARTDGFPYPGGNFFHTRQEACEGAGANILATVEIQFELP